MIIMGIIQGSLPTSCVSLPGLPQQCHRLGGLTHGNLFSHSSRGQQIKWPSGLGSPEASLLCTQVVTSHCLPLVFPPCVCVLISSSH